MALAATRELYARARAAAEGAGRIALLLAALPHFAYALGSVALETWVVPPVADPPWSYFWIGLIGAFTAAYLAAVVMVTAILARAADAVLRAERLVPEAAFETVRARFDRLAVASALYLAIVAAGLALLVIPGFVLAARLALFPQNVLFEYRKPWESLRASWWMTEPQPARALLAIAPVLLAVLPLAGVGVWLFVSRPWLGAIILAAAASAATLGFSVVSATLYRMRFEELAREPAPDPATATAPLSVRYTCPSCERVYVLPRMPPAGAVCPACREGTPPARAG